MKAKTINISQVVKNNFSLSARDYIAKYYDEIQDIPYWKERLRTCQDKFNLGSDKVIFEVLVPQKIKDKREELYNLFCYEPIDINSDKEFIEFMGELTKDIKIIQEENNIITNVQLSVEELNDKICIVARPKKGSIAV